VDGLAKDNEAGVEDDFDTIARLASDFRASRVVLTAVELNLFSLLGTERLQTETLARRAHAQERGVELLANALVGLGLLSLDEHGYACTPSSRRYLDETSPDYRGRVIRLASWWWTRWSDLTDIVRNGNAPDGPPTEMLEDFTLAMQQGKPRAGSLLAEKLDLHGVSRIVDLGGGPGAFAEALAATLPEAQIVVVDRPEVIDIARRHLPASLLDRRIVFVAHDFVNEGIPLAGDAPAPYDLAILSSVVHLLGEEENAALLKRVRDALAPGGRIAIRDFLVDEKGVAPLDAALLAVTMLVSSRRGRCYSFARIKEWLHAAGFGEVEKSEFDGPAVLITARRA